MSNFWILSGYSFVDLEFFFVEKHDKKWRKLKLFSYFFDSFSFFSSFLDKFLRLVERESEWFCGVNFFALNLK